MFLQGQIGPQATYIGDGVFPVNVRLGRQQEVMVSELHGRFYEQSYRGYTFGIGNSDTALTTNNAAATSLGAAAKPILAVYNPSSTTNLVLLQTVLQVTTVGATAVSPAGFNFYSSYNQTAVSTGTKNGATNLKTLQSSGSIATVFTGGNTALTGLSGSLTFLRPVAVSPTINAAGAATAVSLASGNVVDQVDGAILIPPNGILAIMTAVDVSVHASNVTCSMMWEEVPV